MSAPTAWCHCEGGTAATEPSPWHPKLALGAGAGRPTMARCPGSGSAHVGWLGRGGGGDQLLFAGWRSPRKAHIPPQHSSGLLAMWLPWDSFRWWWVPFSCYSDPLRAQWLPLQLVLSGLACLVGQSVGISSMPAGTFSNRGRRARTRGIFRAEGPLSLSHAVLYFTDDKKNKLLKKKLSFKKN